MNLKVYNGEKFERNKLRYIIFSSVFIVSIVLSLINQNIVWAIVLFFILGAYFYYSILSNKIISIQSENDYLVIHQKSYPRSDFTSHTIEVDKNSKKIKNIIFITTKWYIIYSICDSDENVKNFSQNIDQHLPLVVGFNQSILEKIIRLLKL